MSTALPLPRASHIGLSVSDLARSLAFYRDGLGFSDGAHIIVDDDYHALFGIAGPIAMQSQFLRLGTLILELVAFASPPAHRSPPLRPLFHTGLTHLAFRVADAEAVAARLATLGGTVHPGTLTRDTGDGRNGTILFVTDPDGTRIELMTYTPDFDFA